MRTVASLAAVMVLAAMALAAYLLVEEADAVAWIGVPIAAVATAALFVAAVNLRRERTEHDLETARLTGAWTAEAGLLDTELAGLRDTLAALPDGPAVDDALAGRVESAAARLASMDDLLGRIVPAAQLLHDDIAVVNERAAANVDTMERSSRTTREIATALEDTAESTGALADISTNATRSVQQGEDAVQQTLSAVRQVRDVVEEFATTIERVIAQSGEISRSSELVATVAKRTNLLSLNAAIEAARAGSAGQGFAVVAGEIRELASRAASAAELIDQVLEDVNEQFAALMEQMERVSTEVQSSAELAERAGQELERAREFVSSSDTQVQGIRASVEEMSASGGEVAERVTEVAETAAANVDTTADMQQRAGDLHQLAVQAGREAAESDVRRIS
jgi:methyl-accepting chemotaxis protein